MTDVRTAHTADLDERALEAARALLYAAFDDMTEHDWNHNLGGIHAMLWEGSDLIAHASVYQRRVIHGGEVLRAGYVEGMAVREDRRRRGHGRAIMTAIERVIREGHDLGALGATDEAVPLYTSHGWRQWQGELFALTPDGVVRTAEEDGNVYVLPGSAPLDLAGELTCDWRDGDVW